jgi:hypothetical protein
VNAGAILKMQKTRQWLPEDKGAFYLLLVAGLPGCASVDMLKPYNSLTASSLNEYYILT